MNSKPLTYKKSTRKIESESESIIVRESENDSE